METQRGTRGGKLAAVTMAVVAAAVCAPRACVAQTSTFSILYSFQGHPDGKAPHAGVVLGSNGALYGVTYQGGSSGDGTVFQLTPPSAAGGAWTESVIHNFAAAPDGSFPAGGLAFGVGGNAGSLFGTTAGGGTGAYHGGTVFELAPPAAAGGAWTETVLYNFHGGAGSHSGSGNPEGTPLIEPDGTIYGTTYGSCVGAPTHLPTMFHMAPPSSPGAAWGFRTLFNFQDYPTMNVGGGAGGEGVCPAGGLVQQGGALFGTTFQGASDCAGGFGCGAAYELIPPAAAGDVWTGTPLHVFGGAQDGAFPEGPPSPGPGGVLYGTTSTGGAGSACLGEGVPYAQGGCGTVFQLTPPATAGGAWTEAVIYSFTATNGDGAFPVAGLLLGANGVLYGTTSYGGSATSGSPCSLAGASGCGTVFQLTPPASPGGAWTETVLYSFSGQSGDGAMPLAGLTLGPGNVLYGTTSAGGTAGAGTVFSLALN